jgi:hypothetical protein
VPKAHIQTASVHADRRCRESKTARGLSVFLADLFLFEALLFPYVTGFECGFGN